MNIPIINSIVSYLRGDGAVILPEIELVLFGLGILVIDFWIEQKEKYMNAGLALAGTLFSAYSLWGLRSAVAARGEFAGFHDSVVVDPFFLFFSVLFLAATALVTLLSVKFLDIEREQEGEYYALLLFACVGMMLMASGIDLIVLFLGLETMALSFYVLTGFLRREKRSNEAALKYVLLGAFSSGILAYGFSILYGLSGATSLGGITSALARRENLVHVVALSRLPGAQGQQMHDLLARQLPIALNFDPLTLQLLPILAFVLVAVGLFFKTAAVPFHQWAPDVYEGAPTPVTAYVSVASKTASFALLLRLFISVFTPAQKTSQEQWMYLIAGVAVASLTWGNLAALTQTNVKRLLAYSSISHVGFMGKYFIFLSLIETHHPVLAVFAVLYIVPALYYYFRIVVHAWLKQPGEAPRPIMTSAQIVALTVAVFVTLAAGLYPEPFTRLAQYAFGQYTRKFRFARS